MEKISLKEFEQRWHVLLQRGLCNQTTTCKPDGEKDPFDCSSMAIPPGHGLVDQVATDFIEQWRELDERKVAATQEIVPSATDSKKDDETLEPANKKPKTLPKWYEKHVRLPEGFDYATKQFQPPADDGMGDRVLSLQDPTAQTSYHQELWKLFASIPTIDRLEKEATAGMKLEHTANIYEEIAQGTLEHPRLDGHALSRLRMSDRHELPPAQGQQRDTPTIVFECWKRQPSRRASPDPSRMVLEFLGSQTLQDFHDVLVEVAEDELWERESQDSSGYFFIEGVFYTTGSADYVTPIQKWLKSGRKTQRKRRAAHLGLPAVHESLPVRPMANVRLDEIETRLGVRYVHVHHGDVECAVFAVDRKLTCRQNIPYPILHDVWTQPYHTPDCEACQHNPAVIATATDCSITDGGHRALCQACCRQLRLPTKAPDQIERYSVWRNQGDLSAGATAEKMF